MSTRRGALTMTVTAMTLLTTMAALALPCAFPSRAFARVPAQTQAPPSAQTQTQQPQQPPQQRQPEPAAPQNGDPSLDRIRRALDRPDPPQQQPVFVFDPQTPTFRTEVEGHPLDLENYWRPDNDVWSLARPWTPSRVHYDFLRMSLPDEYLGTHRYANPVFPLVSGQSAVIAAVMKPLVSKAKKSLAKQRQNAIRAQIQSELRAIEDANREANRTPF